MIYIQYQDSKTVFFNFFNLSIRKNIDKYYAKPDLIKSQESC